MAAYVYARCPTQLQLIGLLTIRILTIGAKDVNCFLSRLLKYCPLSLSFSDMEAAPILVIVVTLVSSRLLQLNF